MSVLTDGLYGILISLIIAVAGFAMAFMGGVKWGWLILAIGLYWLWVVLGHQAWGITPPPWSPV